MAKGWVLDRYHRSAPLNLTVNAEASNVITVDLELTDQEDNTLEESRTYMARLFDANALLALSTAFRLAETGSGTEISATAKSSLIFSLGSAGTAKLAVTDVAGASGATLYLVITPLNLRGAPVYTTVTFD